MFSSLSSRPQAYFNVDGLGEIGIAAMHCFFCLTFWLQLSSPRDSMWNRNLVFLAITTAFAAVMHFGIRALKSKLTYPRTGYVEYRKADTIVRPALCGFCGAFAVACALVFARRQAWDLTMAPVLLGLFLSAGYAWGFARAVAWKSLTALLLLGTSIAIAQLPDRFLATLIAGDLSREPFPPAAIGGFFLLLLGFGIVTLASGLITLIGYLRTHRVAHGEPV